MFNKYQFLNDLESELQESAKQGFFSDIDVAWDYVHQYIDNQCIYYADCFDIVKELFITDWSDNEYGTITNICQLAHVSLYDLVIDELDMDKVENLIPQAIWN